MPMPYYNINYLRLRLLFFMRMLDTTQTQLALSALGSGGLDLFLTFSLCPSSLVIPPPPQVPSAPSKKKAEKQLRCHTYLNYCCPTKSYKKGGVYCYKRKPCSMEVCTNQSQTGGVCIKHGSKSKLWLCSTDGCPNKARKRKGGVCIRHGANRKRCNEEGCTNQSQIGGVCQRHGAYVKLCSSIEGCIRQAITGGKCFGHRRHDTSCVV